MTCPPNMNHCHCWRHDDVRWNDLSTGCDNEARTDMKPCAGPWPTIEDPEVRWLGQRFFSLRWDAEEMMHNLSELALAFDDIAKMKKVANDNP